MSDEVASGLDGGFGIDADGIGEEGEIEDFRNESSADPLDAVWSGLDGLVMQGLMDDGRGGGFDGVDLQVGRCGFEETRGAGDGAAGADACQNDVDVCAELFGDLGSRRFKVRLGVGLIVELHGHEVVIGV